MKIVLLNVEGRTIKVYDQLGIEEFFFDELDELSKHMGKEKFMYVTNACTATVSDLMGVVQPFVDEFSGEQYAVDGEAQINFLQSCVNGVLIIEEAGIKYTSRGECKEIDEEMYEIMQTSVAIRTLLRQGKLKIVDYREATRANRKTMRNSRKNDALMKESYAARDKSLDDIIVGSSSPGSAASMAEAGIFNEVNEDSDDVTDSIIREKEMMDSMSQDQLDEFIREGKLAT